MYLGSNFGNGVSFDILLKEFGVRFDLPLVTCALTCRFEELTGMMKRLAANILHRVKKEYCRLSILNIQFHVHVYRTIKLHFHAFLVADLEGQRFESIPDFQLFT